MKNAKIIILVRHGESIGNKKQIVKDNYINDCDVPLTENGKLQVKDLAVKLHNYIKEREKSIMNYCFDRKCLSPSYNERLYLDFELWNSPFERTRQTASILNETLKINKVYEDPRLVEQDFGDFDFQFFKDWPKISPHSFYINQQRYNSRSSRFWARVENGESFSDVYNRISLFDISRCQNNNSNQIIVTHGNFILTALMYFTMSKPEFIYDFEDKITNASAYILEKISEDDNKYKYIECIK